jgi:septum formation protein
MSKKLILASGSPRRYLLLEQVGAIFDVHIPNVEEWDQESHPNLTPREIACANARNKALMISKQFPEDHVLGADTIVVCESMIFGKPANVDDAHEMLKQLSGKTHEVFTAVVLMHYSEKTAHETVEITRVKFRELNDSVIENYLKKVNVLDKAGAYAFQEYGDLIIERIEGSSTNVMGLPMEVVRSWLVDLKFIQ